MRIDSHHHLWRYNSAEYPWINESMSVLRRDYLPADLKVQIDGAGIQATVAVQARQTLEETRWLLELANAYSFIAGVVGWVPLVDPDIDQILGEFAGETKLRAVRHVLQDEPDDELMHHADFHRGIGRLAQFGLVYDVLIYARHLATAIEFIDRHPRPPFVLDHIAKPVIALTPFDQEWASQIRELARRDHVACKLSGMATEVRDPEWTSETFRLYFETVLDAFGPDRLMFGTDWPVCLLRCEYHQWVATMEELISELSASEQARIMGLTAERVYGLDGGEEKLGPR
jgi:L-fuconolactonase